jgi:hypothetical protein
MEISQQDRFLVYIWKPLNVILSKAKNLCEPGQNEILRRPTPQNDTPEHGFRMDTNQNCVGRACFSPENRTRTTF